MFKQVKEEDEVFNISGESIYLAHAEEAIIRVEVTPLSGASEGDVKEIYVTGSMTSGAVTRSDTVKITVTRADAAADLKVESQDNYSRFVDFGQTVALQVEVTNNSSWEQTFYIKENTSTTGVGGITFTGSLNGFQPFSGVMTNGDITYYVIEENDKWEVGIGTYIGKNQGRISEIRQNSIVVKELIRDYKGRLKEHVQEIKLHKMDGEG